MTETKVLKQLEKDNIVKKLNKYRNLHKLTILIFWYELYKSQ